MRDVSENRQAGVEVTAEMIKAGVAEFHIQGGDDIGIVPCVDELVTSVFRAMKRASRVEGSVPTHKDPYSARQSAG